MGEPDPTCSDVVRQREAAPVDDYLREIDALFGAHDYFAQDRVTPAIGRGAASREVVQRVALEYHYTAKWTTPELAMLVAGAPDAYCFTLENSTHYRHWAENFADETGYLRDPNRVQMTVDWCRQMGLSDAEIRGYTPIPETIAMVCTMLFYVRRSYEEGLAVFGYAGERVVAGCDDARTMYDGLQTHYGVTVKNFEVRAGAEPGIDRVRASARIGAKASDLFRLIATTGAVQDRCRVAVRNVVLTAECRVRAMNRWVE